jgi:hypothetical protein
MGTGNGAELQVDPGGAGYVEPALENHPDNPGGNGFRLHLHFESSRSAREVHAEFL